MGRARTFIGLIALLAAAAGQAGPAGAADAKRITATFRNESLQSALAKLASLSGEPIELRGSAGGQNVNAVIENATLDESLERVLRGVNHVLIQHSDGGVTVRLLGAGDARSVFAAGAPQTGQEPADAEPDAGVEDPADDSSAEIDDSEFPDDSGTTPPEADSGDSADGGADQ